jgi:hypothetical protein
VKFGVYIGPFYPGEMDGARAFDLALVMARTAHESGFDGIFAAHHYARAVAYDAPSLRRAGPARRGVSRQLFGYGRLSSSTDTPHRGGRSDLASRRDVRRQAALWRRAGLPQVGVPELRRSAGRAGRSTRRGGAGGTYPLGGGTCVVQRPLLSVCGCLDPPQAHPATGSTRVGRSRHGRDGRPHSRHRRRMDGERPPHPHLHTSGITRLSQAAGGEPATVRRRADVPGM